MVFSAEYELTLHMLEYNKFEINLILFQFRIAIRL